MKGAELQHARDFILRCAARMPLGIAKATLQVALPAAGIVLKKPLPDRWTRRFNI